MRLPFLSQKGKIQEKVIAFRGLNKTESATDGDFTSMMGLSTARYPALANVYADEVENPYFATWLVDNRVYYASYEDGTLSIKDWEGVESRFINQPPSIVTSLRGIVMGGKLVLPALGCYIENSFCYPLSASVYSANAAFTGTLELRLTNISYTTSVQNNAHNIPHQFGIVPGDIVRIVGHAGDGWENMTQEDMEKWLQGFYARVRVSTIGDDSANFTFETPIISNANARVPAVTVERVSPDLTNAVAWNNRLWTVDKQTIHASALGDVRNFFDFSGVSTDSWSVGVGTPGTLRGLIPYGSHMLVMSDYKIYRIFGDLPTNYSLQQLDMIGSYSPMTFAMDSSMTAYWLGTDGYVYAYNGDAPRNISEPFGLKFRGNQFVARADGAFYQLADIYQRDFNPNATSEVFQYDTRRGLWSEIYEGVLARLDKQVMKDENTQLFLRNPPDVGQRSVWGMEFAPFREDTVRRKGYHSIVLSGEIEGLMKIEVSEDGKPFREVGQMVAEKQKTFHIPLPPNRCDTYILRLSGEGRIVLRQMVKKYCVYSDK